MKGVCKFSAYRLVSILMAIYCIPASLSAQRLQYISTAVSPGCASVFPGQTNSRILKIKIRLNGTTGQLSAKKFYFTTKGTNKTTDILSAALYFSGSTDRSDSPFNASDTAGPALNNPSSAFVLKTNKALTAGDNYFFLACNLSNAAAPGDTIAARLDSVTVDDTVRTVTGNPLKGIAVTQYTAYCPLHVQVPNKVKFALVGITEVKLDKAFDNISGDNDSLVFYPQKLTAYRRESYPLAVRCGKEYTEQLAAWVDWNNDGFFDNVNELVFRTSSLAPASTYTSTLTIPCNATIGTHRMRLISDIDSAQKISVCAGPYSGDAEEYLVDVKAEPRPLAHFKVDTPSYIGSAILFRNTSVARGDVKYEWDFNNDGIYDTTAYSPRHVFNKTGVARIRLKLTLYRCDSTLVSYYLDSIHVTYPSRKPVPDFIATNNTTSTNVRVYLTDLSTYNPNNWQWEITPSVINGSPAYTYVDNTNYNSQNPVVIFQQPGKYTVSLAAGNFAGISSRYARANLISVIQSLNMCSTDTIRESSGILYDDGGPDAPYGRKTNCSVVIKPPCASSISITFHQLDASIYDLNYGGDRLKIFEGPDSSGTALHTLAGYKHGFQNTYPDNGIKLPGTITSSKNAAYINWKTDSSYLGDGFAIEWSSILRTSSPPKASFAADDTQYVHFPVKFRSSSTGPELRYFWDLDGDGTNDSNDPSPQYIYTQPGTYDVRLITANCGGVDTVYHMVHILAPTAKPKADFKADYTRISTGDAVTLNDLSTQKPYIWRWKITSNNPVANPVFLSGDTTSQNPRISFPDSGFYTIRLTAGNDFGSSQVTKTSYLEVYNHCIPIVDNVSQSLDISRVILTDISKDTLINRYISDSEGYSVFNRTQPSLIEIGGHYTISAWRDTVFAGTGMDAKVWIDYNEDGDFSRPNESVITLTSITSKGWSGTFFVPNSVVQGITRMRIGVGYNGRQLNSCGSNLVGRFVDFNVLIAKDITPPVITLAGKDTLILEQDRPFKDPGATAYDHTDGDLTGKIVIINPLDSSVPGGYTIVYQVSDHAGNIASKSRYVKVIGDTTKPVIALEGNSSEYVEVYHSYSNPGATVHDNVDSGLALTISGKVDTAHIATYTITYTSTDLSGNTRTVKRTVIVGDTTRPVFPNGNDTEYLQVFSHYTEHGVYVIDNYTEYPSLKIQGTVNTSKLGRYIVTYKAKDSSGNIGTAYRYVYVIDTIAPKIRLQNKHIYWDVYRQPFVYPDSIYLSDNYYPVSQLTSQASDFAITRRIGIDTILYYAFDPSGNKSKPDTLYLHVVDRIAPTIQLLGDTIVYVPRWAKYNEADVVTGDNYDPDVKVLYGGSFTNTLVPGLYIRTYQAIDHSGNKSVIVCRWINVTEGSGLAENENNQSRQIMLYPNPASDFMHLSLKQPASVQAIEITDIFGRKVWRTQPAVAIPSSLDINVSTYPSGVYFVNFISGRQVVPRKMVITH